MILERIITKQLKNFSVGFREGFFMTIWYFASCLKVEKHETN